MLTIRESLEQRISEHIPTGVSFQLSGDRGRFRLHLQMRGPLESCSAAKSILVDHLPELIAKIEQFVPLALVQIDVDHLVPVEDIRWAMPDLPATCDLDLELMSYLTREATRSRSLFRMAPDGTYLQAWLTPGADPPKGMELIGANLNDVVGAAATDEILAAAKRARQTGQDAGALYAAVINGEERHYAATVTAMGDAGQFMLSVVRL